MKKRRSTKEKEKETLSKQTIIPFWDGENRPHAASNALRAYSISTVQPRPDSILRLNRSQKKRISTCFHGDRNQLKTSTQLWPPRLAAGSDRREGVCPRVGDARIDHPKPPARATGGRGRPLNQRVAYLCPKGPCGHRAGSKRGSSATCRREHSSDEPQAAVNKCTSLVF